MGKRFLLLFIGTIGHMVFAQQWVDSIQAAREAYHKKEYSALITKKQKLKEGSMRSWHKPSIDNAILKGLLNIIRKP